MASFLASVRTDHGPFGFIQFLLTERSVVSLPPQPGSWVSWRRRRDTRASTRRSRRQAAIRSVIVTMTPLQEFSELDGQRRFVAPLLPAPRDPRQEHVRDLLDQLEIEQFFLIY